MKELHTETLNLFQLQTNDADEEEEEQQQQH